MNLAVLGLWHLGCVTAAGCARFFSVTGIDPEPATIDALNHDRAPLLEPGLNELIAEGRAAGRLRFTTDFSAAAGADILWLTLDTPVNAEDESDVEGVLAIARQALRHLRPGAILLVSSQLPVGTCARLAAEFPHIEVACSPENLRLGRAVAYFLQPDRIVCGIAAAAAERVKPRLTDLFVPFTRNVLWMRTESAEMTKHGLNGFLALSITYANELARLCERVGADAREVAAGVKSDERIGPRAYLGPGGPFAGGTLARDTVTLTRLGNTLGENLEVIPAIKRSNDRHRGWSRERLAQRLGSLAGRRIALLGLTYKPDTDTLRRSAAVELAEALVAAGAAVVAHDPAVKQLPPHLGAIKLLPSVADAVRDADAVVICTEWPVFRQAPWAELLTSMRGRLVVDPNAFLARELAGVPGVDHLSVGRA